MPTDSGYDRRLHGLIPQWWLQHWPLSVQLVCQRPRCLHGSSWPAWGVPVHVRGRHLALDRHHCHHWEHCSRGRSICLHILKVTALSQDGEGVLWKGGFERGLCSPSEKWCNTVQHIRVICVFVFVLAGCVTFLPLSFSFLKLLTITFKKMNCSWVVMWYPSRCKQNVCPIIPNIKKGVYGADIVAIFLADVCGELWIWGSFHRICNVPAAICNMRSLSLLFHVSLIRTNIILVTRAWACESYEGHTNVSAICEWQSFVKHDASIICNHLQSLLWNKPIYLNPSVWPQIWKCIQESSIISHGFLKLFNVQGAQQENYSLV